MDCAMDLQELRVSPIWSSILMTFQDLLLATFKKFIAGCAILAWDTVAEIAESQET
jgi:hypothetical protein